MAGTWTQMSPPKAKFTNQNLPDLVGKVYIITGANTGVGKELAQLLYSKNATVYIGARSEAKATEAIRAIREALPASKGKLEFFDLDLADLEAVAKAARAFLDKESSLDVVFCNAGVMHPPDGSKTKQGYELQQGVHNLGHLLLVELLTPLLAKTAAAYGPDKGHVRVVWVSSLYAEMSRKPWGFDPENIDYKKKDEDKIYKYSASKVGMYYQGVEYAKLHKDDGIISVSVNPGNLKSDLQRHHTGFLTQFVGGLVLHPAVNGAYSELFAGLSPEVTLENTGTYIIPWGRVAPIRADIAEGARSVSEGGKGVGETWYKWCSEQIKPYL